MLVAVEIEPLDRAAGTRAMVRACSAERTDLTGWGGNRWLPILKDTGSIGTEWFDGSFTGQPQVAQSIIRLAWGLLSRLQPSVMGMRWQDAPIRVWAGATVGTMTQVFVGAVDRFEREKGAIKLTAGAGRINAEAKIMPLEYAGTTGIEGPAALKGKLKPWLLGTCYNVEPVLIDEVNNVYQFSAYGPIKAVLTLFERAQERQPSIGDHANYAALVAADIPEGDWATCLAQGLIRLGAPQYGVITGDVEGDFTGSVFASQTGAIITRVATYLGIQASLNATSMTALDTFSNTLPGDGHIGVFLDSQEEFGAFAARLAAPLNAVCGYNAAGVLSAARVGLGSASLTLDGRGRRLPVVSAMTETDTPPPYRRIVMGSARSWRVHSFDEVAFYSTPIERGRWDAATEYRDGDIVDLADGSRWLYDNATPTTGNMPSASSVYWKSLTDPVELALVAATPPADVSPGFVWWRASGKRPFVKVDDAVLFNGEPLLFNGEPLVIPDCWEELKDGAIDVAQATADNAADQVNILAELIDAIDDDGILSISEKVEILIPGAAALEAFWIANGNLAAAAGITADAAYTTAAAERTAWLAYLASITPAWDDTSQQSPISRGALDTARNDYDAALRNLASAATEAITAAQSPDLTGNFAFALTADVTGTSITTPLPFDRRFKAMRGTTDVSPTTNFELLNVSPALSLTVNNTASSADRGVVTVGSGTTGAGTATLKATLPGGSIVERVLTFTKTNATPPAGGGSGATFAQDTAFAPITGTTDFAISDELTVRSDGSGNVRIAVDLAYEVSGGTASRTPSFKVARAATSGGSLTDLFTEEAGSACSGGTEPEAGSYVRPEATFAMPAANTDYFFKLLGRRTAGSGNIAFTGTSFTVRQ